MQIAGQGALHQAAIWLRERRNDPRSGCIFRHDGSRVGRTHIIFITDGNGRATDVLLHEGGSDVYADEVGKQHAMSPTSVGRDFGAPPLNEEVLRVGESVLEWIEPCRGT